MPLSLLERALPSRTTGLWISFNYAITLVWFTIVIQHIGSLLVSVNVSMLERCSKKQ
jgi:hypothetical protein